MVKTTKVCNDKIDEIVSYKELIFSGVFQSREAVTKTKLKTRLIIDVQSLLAMKKKSGKDTVMSIDNNTRQKRRRFNESDFLSCRGRHPIPRDQSHHRLPCHQ